MKNYQSNLTYTTRGTEGEFISLEDSSRANFLQWQECCFNIFLSLLWQHYALADNDCYGKQDGQPDGNKLESGVAIHTLRMPMPYRCPHTNLAYPSSVESLTRLIFREDPSKWVDHGPCNALCRDVEPDERLCAACNIKKDFVLQLRGACKDSLLGIFIALGFSKFSKTKFSFRLQIPDSECGVLCWLEWMDFNDNQAKISNLKPFFSSKVQQRALPMGGYEHKEIGFPGNFKSVEANAFAWNPIMDL